MSDQKKKTNSTRCSPDVATNRRLVQAYIDGVLSGSIPACKTIRRAVERHMHDLVHGPSRGLAFSESKASKAIQFFKLLRHSKGEWAGSQFELSGWQRFILWCMFGWQRLDAKGASVRRFRIAYNELPRKNGKSTFAAGIALKLQTFDGENGAEVYAAATKKDQARIVHGEASRMVRRSPPLSAKIQVLKDLLLFEKTDSKFEAIASDEDTLDGLNVHGAVVDELHAHKTRGCWDLLETATGARRQPLIFAITTAGSDEQTICGELHDYSLQILDGFDKGDGFKDDTLFVFIAALDEEDKDNWADPKTWAKANPNFGISVKADDLAAKVAKATKIPGALNSTLRLHFNVWTRTTTLWLKMDQWRRCAERFDWASLASQYCFGGLDLSKTRDITAIAFAFPPGTDGLWRIKVEMFMPEDRVKDREAEDRAPYSRWIEEGWLNSTPGDETDYAMIRARILELNKTLRIADIGYDGWNASETAQKLIEDGIEMVKFPQVISTFNEPCKTMQAAIHSGHFRYDGNPLLTWMASNTAVYEDTNGNVKPVKPKMGSRKRIDGIVATLMAMGRAIQNPQFKSCYEPQ